MRVAVGGVGAHPHQLQQFPHRLRAGGAGQVQMDFHQFGDGRPHRHPRVEGGERVLENDLHVAAQLPQPAPVGGDDVDGFHPPVAPVSVRGPVWVRRRFLFAALLRAGAAVQPPLQEHLPGGGFHQAQHGAGGGGFAATGFADQAQGAPERDVERHPGHRRHFPLVAAENPAAESESFNQVSHRQGRVAADRRLLLGWVGQAASVGLWRAGPILHSPTGRGSGFARRRPHRDDNMGGGGPPGRAHQNYGRRAVDVG